VCVVVGWVTVVSRVEVVVVVGSDEQELRNTITKASIGVRIVSFFIVWNLIIPKGIRAKRLPQTYEAEKNYTATIGTSRPAKLEA
jgi:hypothetical protein